MILMLDAMSWISLTFAGSGDVGATTTVDGPTTKTPDSAIVCSGWPSMCLVEISPETLVPKVAVNDVPS